MAIDYRFLKNIFRNRNQLPEGVIYHKVHLFAIVAAINDKSQPKFIKQILTDILTYSKILKSQYFSFGFSMTLMKLRSYRRRLNIDFNKYSEPSSFSFANVFFRLNNDRNMFRQLKLNYRIKHGNQTLPSHLDVN